MLEHIIELFQQKYKPAASIQDATDFLDTNEVHAAIEKLIPESGITKKQVFKALIEADYSYTAEPDKMNFNLKWMLIKQY